MSRTLRAQLLLLLTAAIWGFAFVAQRVGAGAMDAYSFNAVRFALGAASLLPVIAFLQRGRPAPAGSWRGALLPGLIAGGLLFGGATLQQLGVGLTTAGNAGFVTGLYIVLVPMIGLGFGQRPNRWLWWGVLLAVAGLFLQTKADVYQATLVAGLFLLTMGDTLSMGLGDALVLAGTAFWAGHILVLEHYSRRVEPLRLALVQVAVCALASGAVALTQERPFGGLDQAVVPVLYGGLMSVGVAYTLQIVGQRHAPAATAALILSLEAAFAVLGGLVVLGESLSLRGLIGCALMLAGLLLAQVGPSSHAVEPGLDVHA